MNNHPNTNTLPPTPAPRRTNAPQSEPPMPARSRHFQSDYVGNSQGLYKNNPHTTYLTQQHNYPQRYPRPSQPKLLPIPHPKPEPMEVDISIRSKAVDYKNRPQNQQPTSKRPYSQQVHQPNKSQRVFLTEKSKDEENITNEQYEEEIRQDENHKQTLVDYIDTYDNPEYDQTEHIDEIYFLD